MADKPSLEELEPIALGFAQALIAKGESIARERLVQQSFELAIDWIRNRQVAEDLIEQHYPNWLEVDAMDNSKLMDFKDPNNRYWAVLKSLNGSDIKVAKARYVPQCPTSTGPRLLLSDGEGNYRGLYVLDPNDYNLDVTPKPPAGVKLTPYMPSITMYS